MTIKFQKFPTHFIKKFRARGTSQLIRSGAVRIREETDRQRNNLKPFRWNSNSAKFPEKILADSKRYIERILTTVSA
ncbi:unnamed protein product [Phyllotreta striolata]|uniref:Uncharacterized protein n=1 Tax=Phyllotreta striolata TaxID=444603 RepID=A0A9N9XKA0_PHYSR|nr:unnamed protein product [Phyllotreta striolata]